MDRIDTFPPRNGEIMTHYMNRVGVTRDNIIEYLRLNTSKYIIVGYPPAFITYTASITPMIKSRNKVKTDVIETLVKHVPPAEGELLSAYTKRIHEGLTTTGIPDKYLGQYYDVTIVYENGTNVIRYNLDIMKTLNYNIPSSVIDLII